MFDPMLVIEADLSRRGSKRVLWRRRLYKRRRSPRLFFERVLWRE